MSNAGSNNAPHEARGVDLPSGAQYIDGELRTGTSGREHTVVDPATGAGVFTYELAGTKDVDAAVAAARAAFPGWAGATPG
ncbi:aldehyde dehydrogenase family protein, partial [Streptomyces sp. T-3]|nr:aldehyde dehydrogenase family protein [Streptomyces sp. T-3]